MIATVANDSLALKFSAPWSLEDHGHFIRSKSIPEAQILFDAETDTYEVRAPARYASVMGIGGTGTAKERLPAPDAMRPDQRWVLDLALTAKRFAAWTDCGWGKTFLQLEYARQVHHMTGGRVLIFAPNAVIKQTIEEAGKFYGNGFDIVRLKTREELATWCKTGKVHEDLVTFSTPFAICNPEKMIDGVLPELRWLSGLIVDESSFLKSGGGVIKWNLIKSARGIEYKLSCTATPAPNDTMEYASQASFLEKLRNEGEILWTFFTKDKRGAWKVKPHARDAFYRFMSSWSIYLRKPGAYGFEDPFKDIPEPVINEIRIDPTPAQLTNRDLILGHYNRGELIPQERLGITQRGKLSQLAKGFINIDGEPARIKSKKPAVVADQVRAHVAAGRQVLVWCVYDEEAKILGRLLRDVVGLSQLHGDTPEEDREQILEDFRHGNIRVLVSKARLLGWGMNFQFCEAMVFSGFDDSFEAFYQAVRRAYRYGSTKQLHVDVPYVPGLEDHIWENVLRKKSQWEEDTAECERAYAQAFAAMGGRAA